MHRCAVIIGVNNTKRMPQLESAIDGAKRFQLWAESQQYETVLHTDESSPVLVSDIKRSVREFVEKDKYTTIIIFFSGHGIWKGGNDEKWLLSNAADDCDEAVNVPVSAMLAQNSGIRHIVFISDACRTPTTDPLIMQVTGSVIFPTRTPGPNPDIDLFYSTTPGDPSYEKRSTEDGISAFGVYTECLLSGLSGEVRDIISRITVDGKEIPVVQSFHLKGYLEKAVPEAIEKIRIDLRQRPHSQVTSREPEYLAKFNEMDQAAEVPAPAIIEVGSHGYSRRIDIFRESVDYSLYGPSRVYERFQNSDFAGLAKIYYENSAQVLPSPLGSFLRNGTGFMVRGATGYLDGSGVSREFLDEDLSFISIPAAYKHEFLLLELENGNGVPLTILPGFIAFITLKNGRVTKLNYELNFSNPKFSEAYARRKAIDFIRELVTYEAALGTMSKDKKYLIEQASYLRYNKRLDPVMGIYAAYAYAQANEWEEVSSVYSYMIQEQEPVLFDVSMLTSIFRREQTQEKLYGLGPLLTQGWAYLSADYSKFPPYLKELARYLVPGLWTTFSAGGVALINKELKNRS